VSLRVKANVGCNPNDNIGGFPEELFGVDLSIYENMACYLSLHWEYVVVTRIRIWERFAWLLLFSDVFFS